MEKNKTLMEIDNILLVAVKDIKKGYRIFPMGNGSWKYMAHSDAYYDTNAGVWRIDIGDGYFYGFTDNGEAQVEIANFIRFKNKFN